MRTLGLAQLGVGGVGSALLRQYLALEGGPTEGLKLVALADSRGAVVSGSGLTGSQARRVLDAKMGGSSLASVPGGISPDAFSDWLASLDEPTILLDTTASDSTLPLLLAAVERGWGIVLANKRPLCARQQVWDSLTSEGLLRYEATVGAGLPVVYSLTYLLQTGDQVREIDGMLSGTLGFLLSRIEEGDSYSSAVVKAREEGYTEPDPRDDLGGMDVARKALILARTLGLRLELADIAVEALYPSEWADMEVDEFLAQAPQLDSEYDRSHRSAAERGEVLRYLAHVAPDGVAIGLRSVPRQSAFGALRGPDNLVVISSARYSSPLRLSGPGAGAEVTAAAVLRDVLDLAQTMRARLTDGRP
ncbi:MAG: homoserine dehydrogenase [Anaerolineae bacterium]|nr:homoserine dehydrogenase [Anaerolineae bacterium]